MSNLHVVRDNGYNLSEIKEIIKDNINKASQSFISTGYFLKYVRDNNLFTEDGYRNIWEFAKNEFGICKSWACKWMQINDRFSIDGNSPELVDKYKDFKSSKLAEMVVLDDKQLDQVTPTTTIVKIRTLKPNRIDYCEADIDKEVVRRESKLEALQNDDFIEDIRKRAQIKLDAVVLLKENDSTERQPHYCPHCHMLIEEE